MFHTDAAPPVTYLLIGGMGPNGWYFLKITRFFWIRGTIWYVILKIYWTTQKQQLINRWSSFNEYVLTYICVFDLHKMNPTICCLHYPILALIVCSFRAENIPIHHTRTSIFNVRFLYRQMCQCRPHITLWLSKWLIRA